uniref:Protein-serine/threonine kinase n=1 Tax=Hirondellea gigas TaxID=1518452 RepID=A0A6A7G9F8_9CRUS
MTLFRKPLLRFFGSVSRVASGIRSDILTRADQPRTGVSMMGMYRMGATSPGSSKLLGAQFLHSEIPLRIARCLKQLHDLPYDMSRLHGIQRVCSLYENIFDVVSGFPLPKTESDARIFSLELQKHLQYPGLRTVMFISLSVMDVRDNILALQSPQDRAYEDELLKQFLDDFYIGRIGMRMLVAQQIGLYTGPPSFVGVIDPRCDVVAIIEQAIADATAICMAEHGVCPPVAVLPTHHLPGDSEIDDLFTYVPGHLHSMVFEILKNSMHAVVKFHSDGLSHSKELPTIEIVITLGTEDITIKIADRGGGVARDAVDLIMNYTYSTSDCPTTDFAEQMPEVSELDMPLKGLTFGPLAGLGYGLPMTKLFARYFGGDMEVVSVDGHGFDVFLYLSRIEHEELLDIR